MSDTTLPAPIEALRSTIDEVGEPMFLLRVDEEDALRFVALNSAHTAQTGLRNPDIAGKTPHEALPARVAETVLASYERCRRTRARTTYEEQLSLPEGVLWWQTTLTPVFGAPTATAAGQVRPVIGLCGIGLDITARKHELQAQTERAAMLLAQGGEARATLAGLAETLRGPVALSLSLQQALRREVRPPFDRKLALLSMMTEATQDVLDSLDALDAGPAGHCTGPAHTHVDLGHLIRHLIAVRDPQGRLSVVFPRTSLRTDADLLEAVLERALDLAAIESESFVRITIAPDTMDIGRVHLAFAFDLKGPVSASGTPPAALRGLERLLAAQSGTCRYQRSQDGSEATLRLSLPGLLDYAIRNCGTTADRRPAADPLLPSTGRIRPGRPGADTKAAMSRGTAPAKSHYP